MPAVHVAQYVLNIANPYLVTKPGIYTTSDTITYPLGQITALTATQEMEQNLVKFRKIKLYFLYLLTVRSRVLLDKLTGSAPSQESPRIFGTQKFLTVLTSARHLSLSRANSIQSPQPPPTS